MATNIRIQELYKVLGYKKDRFSRIYSDMESWYDRLKSDNSYLKLEKQIVESIGSILFNENVKIYTSNENINKKIDEVLINGNKFHRVFQSKVKKWLALGSGVISQFINPVTLLPDMNFIDPRRILLLDFDEHDIYRLAWFDEFEINDNTYIQLVIEEKTKRTTRLFKSEKSGKLIEITDVEKTWEEVLGDIQFEVTWEEDSKLPRFQFFSTNINNEEWGNVPFGNTVFYATKLLDECEKAFVNFLDEYENSAKQIFISKSLLNKEVKLMGGSDASIVRKFDSKQKLWVSVNADLKDDIREHNPTIRYEEFKKALNTQLVLLGQTIGLGQDFLNFERIIGDAKTATEVLLNNQTVYNYINRLRNSLSPMLKQAIMAFVYLMLECKLIDKVDEDLQVYVEFDDSVFIDKKASKAEGLELYKNQLISREYLLKYYFNMTDEEIKEAVPAQKLDATTKI